jgi:hypothetical protein
MAKHPSVRNARRTSIENRKIVVALRRDLLDSLFQHPGDTGRQESDVATNR